ncbi:MAG: hypothetical protein LUD72_05010, partial [Bacteroidales bacterium]|nr:hypothetical protein [Bacteroidales bacterium]
MRLSKSKKILLTILLACVMVMCIAFGAVSTAFAARTVTMTGSNFFYANDGAKIYAYEDVRIEPVEKVDSNGKGTGEYEDGDVKHNYTMFYMTDGDDNVTYRYNLAYHWFAAQTDEDKLDDSCSDSGDYGEGVEGWFSMVIGFNPSFVNDTCDNFDTITIAFQSQQYTKTEDSVTTNYITFVNNGETNPKKAGVYVVITDDEEETKVTKDDFGEDDVLLHTMNGTQGTGVVGNTNKAARITIEFTGYGVPEYDEDTDELISSHNGEYSVRVSSDAGIETDEDGEVTGNSEVMEGYFKNVGGNYSKRVNSTTAGVMPLTFSATFDGANRKDKDTTEVEEETGETDEEDGTGEDVESGDGSDTGTEIGGESEDGEVAAVDENLPNECGMVLFELNGQSFEYSDAESTQDTYYKNGDIIISGSTVNDNAPPVLCLETNLKYLSYGQALSFDYTVVDVLASSPKSEISYYVLTADQYTDANLDYNRVADEETDEDDESLSDGELEKSLAKSPFTLTTDDNRLLIETDIPYLPEETVEANKAASQEGGTGYTTECLAKVCILLTDITSSAGNNKTTYIMLDWYLEDAVTIHEGEKNEANFIPVVKDSQGLSYGYFTEDGSENRLSYSDVMSGYTEGNDDFYSLYTYNFYDAVLAEKYQAEVDKLARDGQEYLLTAGSTSYFYLPEYNGFLGDNLDSYENLTFSVYYDVNGEQGSNTGLAYNALAISLGSEGKYTFTVYATDSSSNKMYYI